MTDSRGGRTAPGSRTLFMLHGSGGVTSLGRLPVTLRRDYEVIAPSHPGFDDTAANIDRIDTLADMYLQELDRQQLENVTLMGFSLGGWVALEMLTARTNRIRSAVLVDPIGVQAEEHPYPPPPPDSDAALLANYHDPAPFRAARALATEDDLRREVANQKATASYLRQGAPFDESLPSRLATVHIPVLLIWGEDERVVPLASFEKITRSLAGPVTTRVIPDAGHRPHQEQPALVEAAVKEFLQTP